MSEKEKMILNFMEKLQISREEAEQLFEDDKEDYIGEQGEEMSQKAKALHRYEKAEGKQKTQKERTKKENPTKKMIIENLFALLETISDCAKVTNEERQIAFSIGENDYEVTLVQKRKSKK